MDRQTGVWITGAFGLAAFALLMALGIVSGPSSTAQQAGKGLAPKPGSSAALPLVHKYCLECHSAKTKRGGLDLERFASADDVRKDLKPWQGVIEHLDAGDMPPRGKPQPTAAEKQQILNWVHGLIEAQGSAQAGDPGYVPLRRLSNAEYDYTIRDLTGVDLQPTREFPAEGAAGEGFSNAAEALTEISPALLTKYFNAAKEVAGHAVFLPDGIRFYAGKNRRDWTNDSTAKLREFFASYTDPEGKLPYAPYVAATVRHRAELTSSKATIRDIAGIEKLNPKYLGILWQTLTDKTPSYPLDAIRAHWRHAEAKDAPALAAEIAAWQNTLWQVVRVGSYVHPVGKGYAESTTRQVPADPAEAGTQPIRLAIKPSPGQTEVVVYLSAHDALSTGTGPVVWHNPRFEAPGKPALLLRDYAQYGPRYEADYPAVFAHSSQYLAAVAEAAGDGLPSSGALAQKHGLDAAFLQNWIDVLGVNAYAKKSTVDNPGRIVPTVPLELLEDRLPSDKARPAISGWRKKGADLPALITNSSNTLEHIPGNAAPHGVMVHPTPSEFVAVAWKSPITGNVRLHARITHAHPACGNGVAWWLEHRTGERTTMFAEGVLEVGGEAKYGEKTADRAQQGTIRKVEKGDLILLAVDAKNGDHACDLTDIALNITQADAPGQRWDLAADIADGVLEGNPHADKYGNASAWSFVKGPTHSVAARPVPTVSPNSVLARWRDAAIDPARHEDAVKLAEQAERLLAGTRPGGEKDPDRLLYDNLVLVESPLLRGIDLARVAGQKARTVQFGLSKDRFGSRQGAGSDQDASLFAPANTVVEVRLPAALFREREFVVEGAVNPGAADRAVVFHASTDPPAPDIRWDTNSRLVTAPTGAAHTKLLQGTDEFRRCFPLFLCFPPVIPNDEVVSLKMFHREDAPLRRLFLEDAEARRLEKLWTEHRFISRQPAAENTYLPLFIGFVTQDAPKEMVTYFEGQRPAFRARADAFEKEEQAAVPQQLDALLDFASRAYRRPLLSKEKSELLSLYRSILARGVSHEEALRGALARVLVAPAFLFRIEDAAPGSKPAPINDWELATRLSYFLWASAPDAELRGLAGTGTLHTPEILAAQTRRMLKDDRCRALAVEFGAQWIHVRGFDALNEKNEKLFPTFDPALRGAIYEETLRFFQNLFQADRPVTDLLDADYTFLNESLANHYGIPGVTGPQWRQVDGVQKYGRGGLLGLASIQAKESGASRTSPTLRGNWLVETLLGEKLPRPPANVPQLPADEGADGLTMRQQVQKHAHLPECAICHQRIDPFGFALESYDPIGRLRRKDLSGLPVDATAKLKDGTGFEGIDGLRRYLLTQKKDVINRLFCRRLLGYALGRAVASSDQPLISKMLSELNGNQGRLSAAVLTIVQSPQFRMIRGRDFTSNKSVAQNERETR